MKKRTLVILLTALLLMTILTSTAFAADTVTVTLPAFSVTLNGQTNANTYSKYPFLVYRDITYFPMTYCDCRLLGIRTDWTAETGLSIEKNEDAFYEYTREVQTFPNAKLQRAQIATGKICVNGKTIDNSKEQYPLLSFRDVTYFPMTWRFAVEEFGWDYTFDTQNGLVITNLETVFETPEAWSGGVSDWGGLMGTGDLSIFCTFDNGTETGASLRLYNVTGKAIRFLPENGHWEYRIYRLIGKSEELVYRKAIPFYSGTLDARNYAYWQIDDGYRRLAEAGTYHLTVIHPNQYVYETTEGGTETSPVLGNAYAQTFSATIEW